MRIVRSKLVHVIVDRLGNEIDLVRIHLGVDHQHIVDAQHIAIGSGLVDAFGHDDVGTIGAPTTINSGDLAGILLIAVQALEKRTAEVAEIKAQNEDLCAQIEELRSQNEEHDTQMAEMQALMQQVLQDQEQ